MMSPVRYTPPPLLLSRRTYQLTRTGPTQVTVGRGLYSSSRGQGSQKHHNSPLLRLLGSRDYPYFTRQHPSRTIPKFDDYFKG